MKKIKMKFFSLLCMMFMVFSMFAMPEKIHAAGLSVSASSGTIYVGDTVTFTVSASNGAGNINVSGAVSDSVWLDNGSKSYSVTGSQPGTITVSASGVIADYDTEKDINVSDSATVTVIARPSEKPSNGGSSGNSSTNTQPEQPKQETPKEEPKETKSNNSALASLSVKEGKLSPEFAVGTTSYKLNLPEGTKSINVEAKAKDSKASVSGTGKVDVKDGDNAINITVTAEDGSTTVYTIKAYVQEKAVATLTLGDKKLNAFQNVKGAALDNKAFEKTKIKVNNAEIPAWKSESLNLTLLYLNGDDGNNFYIYDEKTQKVTSIYKPVGVLGENLVIVDVPAKLQTRSNMKFTTIEVDKVKFPGWTFEDEAFKDYAIIYALDANGKEVYYQYDSKEKTLQRFSGAAAISQEKYDAYVKAKENKEQTLMYVIYGLGAGCVVCLGLAGYFFFHGRKPKVKHKKVDIEKEDYENRFHIEKEDE